MAITIIRNQDGNCITFRGSSNPAYWNACLSGEVAGSGNLAEYVNVRNDIASASGEDVYEFYQIHYTEFRRADNSTFANAADAAAYITEQGNVVEIQGASYLGTWDAATNEPELADDDTPNTGDFYLVGTSGTTLLGGVSSWKSGDRVIWSGSSWQILKSASLIEGTTTSILQNTQTSIFADGEAALRDPLSQPGWYYTNTENNKINWYFYGDTPHIANTLVDVKGVYAVVTFRNTTSQPYLNIYTKAEGDSEDYSWYRSVVTYSDPAEIANEVTATDVADGTKFLLHSGDFDAAQLALIEPELPRIALSLDTAATFGLRGDAEELYLMSLSTSSNRAAGSEDFLVEKYGYVLGAQHQQFLLTAPPTTGATTSDDTPDSLDFRTEATGTTILADDGNQYSINSVHAVDNGDGTLDIVALPGLQVIYDNLDHSNITITGSAAGSNVGNTVNALNALFTNTPLGAGGTYQPVYPVLDGVEITDPSDPTATIRGTATPTTYKSDGTTLHKYAQTSTSTNADIIWSTETIDAAGEYYTVKIAGGGRFIIGLGREEDGDRTDLANPGTNAAAGLIWGQAFYDYGLYTAPWTIYGSSPGLSYGPGWSFGGNDKMMRYNDDVQGELDNGAGAPGLRDGALFKIGIDQNSYISCWYYDAGRSNDWILTSRRTTVTAAGNYFLVVKLWDGNNVMVDIPLRSAVDPAAPVLNYHYIESPDGAHTYPLFASADEAAYVDEQFTGAAAGSGEVQAHVFIDEPTGSVWYKPEHVGHLGVQFPPSDTADITYTEIPTLADDLYAPAALNIQDYTINENDTVNIQIIPQDVAATVTGLPSGLTYSNGYITGTAGYVIRDTDYTVTVERSNSYGTTTETFTITVADSASLSDIAGFTETQGNFVQPNRIILDHDALLQYDTQINPGEELTYSYSQIPPTIGILSDAGENNLANFDPTLNDLGDTGNNSTNMGSNFAWRDQWDLRYVSFGGYIGVDNSEKHRLTGWVDNTEQPGAEGTLANQEFKLEYGSDGYFRLYVGGVLKLTSANTFSGAQTLTFVGFDDQQQTDVYVPSNLAIATTGAGSTTPPTGFVDPVESGEMASTTTFGNGTDSGVVFLTETLKVNHRYIVPRAWIEANVLPNIAGSGASASNDEQFLFGVPKTGVNWATVDVNHFHACFRVEGTSSGNLSRLFYNNTSSNTVSIASTTSAFYDYAIEWDGTDLHVIACNIGDINTQPGINNGGSFSRVGTFSNFAASTGSTNTELNLVIAVRNGAQVDLTTSGLQQIRIPFGARDVIVGEASGGGSMFALDPAASVYDSHSNGHASTTFGMSFDAPTLNAGYTYRFIYHPSMEAGDDIKFTRIDDGTDYTLGVTFFDGTSNGDPNFTDGYKGVTFVVPSDAPPLNVGYNNDHQGNVSYVLKPLPLSGSTYTVPVDVDGVTQIGPGDNQTGSNWGDVGDLGFIQVDELVGAGERITFPAAFFHDLISNSPGYGNTGTRGVEFRLGFKDTNFDVNSFNVGYPNDMWEGGVRLFITHTQATVYFRLYGDQTGTTYSTAISETNILGSNIRVFFEITNSGNSIRAGMSTLSAGDDIATTPFSEWSNYKVNTGDQGFGITTREFIMMRSPVFTNTAALDLQDIDFSVINEVSMPQAGSGLTTSWTKALDFSGSAERTQQVENNFYRCPIMMAGLAATAGPGITTNVVNTSNDGNSRPWATAIVFSPDNHNSNQHIWNCGEGTGSTDDNIYLRLSASGQVYFGWGRDGALNECFLGNVAAGSWYGLYISSNGERLSGNDASANNLARCFDIRWVTLSSGQVQNNSSTASNWTSTGGRMDRAIAGTMTIGGRGSNRSFHGKVASMVVTTLRTGTAVPQEAEISMMVRDPMQWLTDYKVGNAFRLPWQNANSGFNFNTNDGSSSYSTQVWLMGDGTSDAYAQIRNQVFPNSTITPMNMVSMVSNDIETVNIGGLS